VICADVIEHVAAPDELLEFLAALGAEHLVISTPDRNELHLGTEDGPPKNIHHVREWTLPEFLVFLADYFAIINAVRGPTAIVECAPKR
jgi:2-polyprenyl-3-methyl-5-hydroxy-6-metoxy-1,4-benzoquinol methylase